MKREVVDAALDSDGAPVVLSTRVPGDGESHRCRNQLHRFDGSHWALVQEWTGWQATGLATAEGFLVCSSVRALQVLRGARIEILDHPEPERTLNCCFRVAGAVYVGGSTGYYLTVDVETTALEAHNLAHLGIPKPGRDILGFAAHEADILICGSSRLLARVGPTGAAALVSIGPTAATPHLIDVAIVDGNLFAASWDKLWRVKSGDLEPLGLPEELSEVSAIAKWDGGLLVGSQSIFSLSASETPALLFRHRTTDVWACRFLHRSVAPPLAIFSDGSIVELAAKPKEWPPVPLERNA